MAETENQEEFYGQEQVLEETHELVSFFLGEEQYALRVTDVLEIFPVGQITRLPGAPPEVSGLTNHRGAVLPLINLKKIFNLETAKPGAGARVIVAQYGEKKAGLLVDSKGAIDNIPKRTIDPPLSTLQGGAAAYIGGETKINGKLVGILNIGEVLKGGTSDGK